VNVNPAGGAAVYTVNCASAVVNGTYTQNTALTAVNTVTITVNVTTIGTYTITTTATNGMTFTATGSFATTGNQTVTLAGSGTPTTSGANTIPVPSGTTPCNFTVNVSTAPDYYPRTTNSNWSYEYDDVSTDSLFRKVIAQTLTVAGNVFNIFMENDGTGFDSSGYFRKSGGDYYEWIDIGSYIGFTAPQWAEYIFLKDNVAAGTSWNSASYTGMVTGFPTPLTVRLKYTILQKDVPFSVTTSTGTVSHPNTIVVEERVELFNGTGWDDLSDVIGLFKNYYSRNVGLIQQEYYDPADLTTRANWSELRRYLVL
jgi:hypothetical protein